MASKAGIVPMVLAAVVGGSAALLLTQLYFSIWIEPSVTAEKVPPVLEVKPTVPDAMAKDRPESITKKYLPNPLTLVPMSSALVIKPNIPFALSFAVISTPTIPVPLTCPILKSRSIGTLLPKRAVLTVLKSPYPQVPCSSIKAMS